MYETDNDVLKPDKNLNTLSSLYTLDFRIHKRPGMQRCTVQERGKSRQGLHKHITNCCQYGRADGKGDEGSPRVDAVCRRHRVVRRQGCGHDRVPGVVEESLGREGNAGQ